MSHLGKRLSALVDGELDGEQRERVLAHLVRCEPCRVEAATLRMLKQRMRALGDATAGEALTGRLIALANLGDQPDSGRWLRITHRVRALPGRKRGSLGCGFDASLAGRDRRPGQGPAGRRRRPLRALAATAVVLAAVGVPAAGFALGGGQQAPGPEVTPAVDVFIVQHGFTTGEAPARSADPPSTRAAPGGQPGPGAPPRR